MEGSSSCLTDLLSGNLTGGTEIMQEISVRISDFPDEIPKGSFRICHKCYRLSRLDRCVQTLNCSECRICLNGCEV